MSEQIYTLAEQIEALRREIELRDGDEFWPLRSRASRESFDRETDCLRVALRTLEVLIDEGK